MCSSSFGAKLASDGSAVLPSLSAMSALSDFVEAEFRCPCTTSASSSGCCSCLLEAEDGCFGVIGEGCVVV